MSIFSSEREPVLGSESKSLAVDAMADYMENGHSEWRQFAGCDLGFSESPYVPNDQVYLLPRNPVADWQMHDEMLRRIMRRTEQKIRRYVMLGRMRRRSRFRPVNAKFGEYFHVENRKLRGIG